MTTVGCCALLRGIGPSNPNMRNDKLRGVFEELGFSDVGSVLSSGNIVFGAKPADVADLAVLEDRIQQGLHTQLGIPGGTIVRTKEELQTLVDTQPFGAREHQRETYLTATFFKHPFAGDIENPNLKDGEVVGYDPGARALLLVTDNTKQQTPDVMAWMERQFGKDITTRTWLTVQRILRKLG